MVRLGSLADTQNNLIEIKFLSEGDRVEGRAGARGEFSRRPGESGSMYGASVFADEYAAQQTQLVRASGAQQREPAVAAQGAAQ